MAKGKSDGKRGARMAKGGTGWPWVSPECFGRTNSGKILVDPWWGWGGLLASRLKCNMVWKTLQEVVKPCRKAAEHCRNIGTAAGKLQNTAKTCRNSAKPRENVAKKKSCILLHTPNM